MTNHTPDAALLWARERLVERHDGLPHLQKRIANLEAGKNTA